MQRQKKGEPMSIRNTCAQFLVVSAAFLTPWMPIAVAGDWYVDINDADCPTGTGGPDDPFCNISDALGPALDGDTIHIAPGTYFENLVVEHDVWLIGSSGASVTFVDGSTSAAVIHVGSQVSVNLSGLTVSNGNNVNGGGIYIADSSVVEIADSSITNNSASNAGGGIYLGTSSSLTLTNSTVSDNDGAEDGAGIHVAPYANLEMSGSDITGNVLTGYSALGGGVFLDVSAKAYVTDCSITANDRTNWYGGGGGFLVGSSATLTVTESAITGNDGRGIETLENGTTYLTNTTITGNVVPLGWGVPGGGGILNRGTATVTGCRVNGNTGDYGAGGIENWGSLTVTNSTIENNIAWAEGGGGILNAGTATVSNSTVRGNYSCRGGGGILSSTLR